jgi:putative DNA primase/helicase
MAFIAPDSVADLALAEPEPEAEPAKQDKPMLAVPFSLIPAQAVWWLWKGLIPFRHVTLFVAPGKTGKGTTLADIAARMTKGRAMPGDTEKRDPMNVVIIAPEDDANEALRPRLEAAGADMDKVFNLTKFSDGTQFYLPDNITDLAVAVEQIEKQTGLRVGLVIIDPVLAIVTKSINGNAAARSITNPLEDFAKQPLDFDPLDPDNEDAVHPGLAVVLTQHTTKAGKTASSQGLVDSVRMVVRVERLFPKQNEHPGRRI